MHIGAIRNTDKTLPTTKRLNSTNDSISVLGIDISLNPRLTSLTNYSKTAIKVKGILEAWKERDPSLIGKVMLVNSLVASLFVYKMNVLRIIPDNVVTGVNKQIVDFLGTNRGAKIALHRLMTAKNTGGLQLVNLEAKDKSLKIQWVYVYTTTQK